MVQVAILGFTAFERSTLTSYFRLAVNRTPSYRLVTVLSEADCVIVDSDHAPSVEMVVADGRSDRSIFIGAASPAGASCWMPRPIDMLLVLRELDAIVALSAARRAPPGGRFSQSTRARTVIQDPRRESPAAARAPEARSPASTDLDLDALAAGGGPTVPGSTPLSRGAEKAGGHIDLEPTVHVPPRRAPAAPEPAAAPSVHRLRALLVDDSTLALRFLQSVLERHGVITDTATNSQHALAKLAQRRADIVFVDVELGADSTMDGLALCQQIKRGAGSTSGEAPKVAMVSAHTQEIDRARGLLAGCDAYFGKPLVEAELERYLEQLTAAAPARRDRPV